MEHILLLRWILSLLLLSPLISASPLLQKRASTSATWKTLYQNNANWATALTSSRQTSYLLSTTNVTNANSAAVCTGVNETPVNIPSSPVNAGLTSQLQYLIYDRTYVKPYFWIRNTRSTTSANCSALLVTSSSVTITSAPCKNSYPVLCTNSAPRTTSSAATNNATYAISVNGFTAYRDAFSFRFMQVPFANTPTRFAPSTVYTPSLVRTVPSTSSQCPQGRNAYSEDCLVANIYTPVISAGSNPFRLKPIMMWVFGGGFTTGSGQDATFDGGSLASRGDVIVVTPNYRLGTFGFLSVNNQASGNYALSDLITCLKWIQANAATFGGDPTKVTVFGQSAGGQLVDSLLASPSAAGLFQRAIVQSGRPADAANLHITAAVAQAGPAATTLSSLGCTNNSAVLDCLRGLSVSKILSSTVFSKIVVDGNLVTEPNVDVAQLRRGYVNKVPVIRGFMRDELGSLGYAPPKSQKSLDAALTAGGITAANRSIIEGNTKLFPVSSATNGIQNLTVTVETDSLSISRCGQESTINAAASTGVFNGLWAYVQDQRSYQIYGYDPNGICLSTTSATFGYYLCHSGDLYPVFNTAGYVAQYPVRDSNDVVHSGLMMDFWTQFARYGDPNPKSGYLSVRGYKTTLSHLPSSGWTPATSNNLQILSVGPSPVMKPLGIRGPQCTALSLPINYISQDK